MVRHRPVTLMRLRTRKATGMETLGEWWAWLMFATPVPARGWRFGALLLGALIVLAPKGWRRTRLLATYVHEAGHAVVALAFGRAVTGIRLAADSSGETLHRGEPKWFSRVMTAFAGYPAPALTGWGLVAAATTGHARWGIATLALVVLVLSVVQFSWRGWVVTLLLAAGLWVSSQGQGVWVTGALLVFAGYLLAASPRTIYELHMIRVERQSPEDHSDADNLAALTLTHPLIWEGIFLAVCVVCLWQVAVLTW